MRLSHMPCYGENFTEVGHFEVVQVLQSAYELWYDVYIKAEVMKVMKGTLHITNSGNEQYDILTYSIHLGYGISVDQHNYTYSLITAVIRSAKRIASKLGITIQGVEYHDKNGESYKLRVSNPGCHR